MLLQHPALIEDPLLLMGISSSLLHVSLSLRPEHGCSFVRDFGPPSRVDREGGRQCPEGLFLDGVGRLSDFPTLGADQ